jgi:hypothetical protein
VFHGNAGQDGSNARCDSLGDLDSPAVVILTNCLPVLIRANGSVDLSRGAEPILSSLFRFVLSRQPSGLSLDGVPGYLMIPKGRELLETESNFFEHTDGGFVVHVSDADDSF